MSYKATHCIGNSTEVYNYSDPLFLYVFVKFYSLELQILFYHGSLNQKQALSLC